MQDNLTPGNVKAAMKELGAVSADLWQVKPDQLRIIEGFNVRVVNDKYRAHVRWIADMIHANGFYKDKALTGYVAREGDAEVVYITGGHRRHEAVLLAISEGATVPVVPVIIKPKGTSLEDLTVDLHVGNGGEEPGNLTMYEQSIVCKRLAGFQWNSVNIARRMGYASTQQVDNLLLLASAPLPIRRMVMEEIVSATTAIATIKKHGNKAGEVLQTALKAAAGTKVKPKNLPQAAYKKAVRKAAEPMHLALSKLVTGGLTDELMAEINELLKGIAK